MCKAEDSTLRMCPVPWQRGQDMWRRLAQRSLQTLPGQFHEAKAGDLPHLNAGTVIAQRVAQAVLDLALVAGALHVDEVDHDQSAEVAQPQLAGKLVGSLKIGAECCLLDVRTAGGARGVDIDRHHGLGVVDHDRAAGGQGYLTGIGRLDLVLDLEAREQGNVVVVQLDSVDVGRHHVRHELPGLLVDGLGVDQQLADFLVEIVADRTDDQAGFLVDQERAGLLLGCGFDRAPQLQQIVKVPLQFFERAPEAGGAADDAHARVALRGLDEIAQVVAFLTLDAARHAAASRVVRHQDEVATCQADKGGERCALVAALVFVDLDDQLLALAHHILDARAARVDVGLEEGAAYLFEWEEAVPFRSVVYEGGFKTWFDAGDQTLIDISFTLFLAGGFNIQVN